MQALALEAEMVEAIGAGQAHGRPPVVPQRRLRADADHAGWDAGAWVPQDLGSQVSTELFERYQRSEKALVGTQAEM
jgi:hypothetical protein